MTWEMKSKFSFPHNSSFTSIKSIATYQPYNFKPQYRYFTMNAEIQTCKTSGLGWLSNLKAPMSDFPSLNLGGTGPQVTSQNRLQSLKSLNSSA